MFSAASLDAGLVAQLSKDLMMEIIYNQEEKKDSLETQQLAAQTTCNATIAIGVQQQAAASHDGWSAMAAGIGTGGGELLGMGSDYLGKRTSLKKVNADIENNKNCQDILLGKTKPGQAEVTVSLTVEQKQHMPEIKKKIQEWKPNEDLSSYTSPAGGTGEIAFKRDAAALRNDKVDGGPEALEIARKNVKDQLKDNRELKKTLDGTKEDRKNKLRTFGQTAGQCASGLQTQQKGENQETQAEKECLKAMSDFVNASSRGNTDADQKSADLKQKTSDDVMQTLSALIRANQAA